MTWGDLVNKLHPFEQFNFFDISQVTNTFNLQDSFARQWNTAHPHTADCVARHQPIVEESISADFLVCLVNSDDLDDEFDPTHPIDDYNTCICPSEIRPYKTKNALWSLQKAVQFTFNLTLDKSITLNTWSCGLDLYLHTWRLDTDKRVLFPIGTNSVRNTLALQIITQVEDIISMLRSHHPHLVQKTDITIATVFPCYKPSSPFQTHSLLSSNVNNYNELLRNLSSLHNFSILDIPITGDHLGRDGTHLDSIHISYLSNTIQEYVHDLMNRIWPLKEIKAYLTYKKIQYNRLPEIWKQKLCIQFTNPVHREHAEKTLTLNDFDENSYSEWCSQEH
ncbi:unnamed protein product [Rotaria magnacalcarata]|uniref:Uncharacterized protein n=1 Tax=Rotaria magnacalcarata TaxID=392030 RepID=A0A820BMR8_9BILA|nr:unnamed protein product [Rotaria magnacalcarata]CAF4195306.1 unnamed protein product [Rotaria magnacalcarata]